MSKSLKAAIYETHGNPAEVLRIVEQPWPDPAPDEVVVKMAAAPINPADLNAVTEMLDVGTKDNDQVEAEQRLDRLREDVILGEDVRVAYTWIKVDVKGQVVGHSDWPMMSDPRRFM